MRERRRAREEEHQKMLRAEQSARDARLQADLLMKREEERRRRGERREEAAIREHMTAIRRHMRKQQERNR